MKVVASVPIKARSQRVPGKNIRLLGGKPLCQYIIEAALQADLDGVYVNTDCAEAAEIARGLGCEVLERPERLSRDDANGNHLLVYDAEQVQADIYVQLFATAPFLRPETIRSAVQKLREAPEHDSVMTVNALYSWFWFGGKPVNFDPLNFPRSQDAVPVIVETTGLYAIRREALLKRQSRTGANPYMLEVSELEGVDIDTETDWDYAAFLMERHSRQGG